MTVTALHSVASSESACSEARTVLVAWYTSHPGPADTDIYWQWHGHGTWARGVGPAGIEAGPLNFKFSSGFTVKFRVRV